MHIYYYYKDGYAYVIDDNHKLYRYHDNINLETILKTENLIKRYTRKLNTSKKKFPFKYWKELDVATQYNIQQFIQGVLLLQYHYFPNSYFYGVFTEFAMLDITNKLIEKIKIVNSEEYDLENNILLNRLEGFIQKYDALKNIGIVKEEVSLSYLDNTVPKQYINTLKLEEIYKEINKDQESYKIDYSNLQRLKTLLSLFPRMGIYGAIVSEIFIKYEVTNSNDKKYGYYIQIFFCLFFLLSRYSISKINKKIEEIDKSKLTLKRKWFVTEEKRISYFITVYNNRSSNAI